MKIKPILVGHQCRLKKISKQYRDACTVISISPSLLSKLNDDYVILFLALKNKIKIVSGDEFHDHFMIEKYKQIITHNEFLARFLIKPQNIYF